MRLKPPCPVFLPFPPRLSFPPPLFIGLIVNIYRVQMEIILELWKSLWCRAKIKWSDTYWTLKYFFLTNLIILCIPTFKHTLQYLPVILTKQHSIWHFPWGKQSRVQRRKSYSSRNHSNVDLSVIYQGMMKRIDGTRYTFFSRFMPNVSAYQNCWL